MFASKEHEVVLSGPADTGKSMACVLKLHAICALCPGAQVAMVRKTYSSMAGSIVKTFERVTKDTGVKAYGGSTPSRFMYPNGSVVWIGGLDSPERVLSSERDAIYVCQAEELDLHDWETLLTRCSGRASIIEHPQLFADANPGGSKHWIRQRAFAGKIRLLNSRHEDNPTIYDKNGLVTASGKQRLAVLDSLTGVRRRRLFLGEWATAEGAVYDNFDSAVHVKVRQPGEMKRFMLAVDEGYTNPAVVLLIGEDGDGRWHCFNEFYQRGVLQAVVVSEAKERFRQYNCELAAVDESAAGLIADLVNAGVRAVGGKGRVLDGIQAIQNRLKVQGDRLPRYTIDPSCVNHINEFESYIWKPEKDVPVKDYDHSLDALRYLHDVVSVPTGAWDASILPLLPPATDDNSEAVVQLDDFTVDLS